MSKDKHWLGKANGTPFATRETAVDFMRNTGVAGVIKEHPNYGYGVQVKSYTPADEGRLLTYNPEEYLKRTLQAKADAASIAVSQSPMERYASFTDEDDAGEVLRHENQMARNRVQTSPTVSPTPTVKAIEDKVSNEQARFDAAMRKSQSVISEDPLTAVQNRIRGQQLLNQNKAEQEGQKSFDASWTAALNQDKSFDSNRGNELNKAWYSAHREDATRNQSEESLVNSAYKLDKAFNERRSSELSKAWYSAHRENNKLNSAEDSMLTKAYAMDDKHDTKTIEGMLKEDARVQSQGDNIRNAYWKQEQAEEGRISNAEEKARYKGWLLNNNGRGSDGVLGGLAGLGTGTDTGEILDVIRNRKVVEDDTPPEYKEHDLANQLNKSFTKKRDKEFSKAWYAGHREDARFDKKAGDEEARALVEALKDNTKAEKDALAASEEEKKGKRGNTGSPDKVSDIFDNFGKIAGFAVQAITAGAGAAIDVGNAVADNAEREQIGGASTGYSRSGYAGLLKQMGLGNRVGDQVLGAASNATHQVMQSPDALSGILERMATANALGKGQGLDLQGIAKDLLSGDTDSYLNRMKTYTEANKGNERVVAAVTGVVGLQQLSRANEGDVDSTNVSQRASSTDAILANRIKLESALADALGGNLPEAIEGSVVAMKGFVEAAKKATEELSPDASKLMTTSDTVVKEGINDALGVNSGYVPQSPSKRLSGMVDSAVEWFTKPRTAKPLTKINYGKSNETFTKAPSSPVDVDEDFDYAPHSGDEEPIPMSAYATNEQEFMSKFEGKSPEERAAGYGLWQQTPQFKQQMNSLYGEKANLQGGDKQEILVRVEGDVRTLEGTVKLTQVGTARVTSQSVNK